MVRCERVRIESLVVGDKLYNLAHSIAAVSCCYNHDKTKSYHRDKGLRAVVEPCTHHTSPSEGCREEQVFYGFGQKTLGACIETTQIDSKMSMICLKLSAHDASLT